jgi:ABC-2 type transport system ATP-binding protein
MITVEGLTKRYGDASVVDDLTFEAQPGRVTGFLGPNGAGKTQTIKMILGLVKPAAGTAEICGRPIAAHDHPPRVVGAVLDGGAFHPGRTGRAALRLHARYAGVPACRVTEALREVGLASDAGRRVAKYSLGMRQRLALAQGLLARPAVLIADEPVNGLDPAGISWIRRTLRRLADDGMTIFVSSHLLGEAEQLIDDAIVITRGRLVARGTLEELRAGARRLVEASAADPRALGRLLHARGLDVSHGPGGVLRIAGADAAAVGRIADEARLPLQQLAQREQSLEDRFLELTGAAEGEPR